MERIWTWCKHCWDREFFSWIGGKYQCENCKNNQGEQYETCNFSTTASENK